MRPHSGANRVLLGHHGLQDEVSALNRDLVQLSREAVGTEALLAGDMTTTASPSYPATTARMPPFWIFTANRPKRFCTQASICSPWRR